MVLDLRKRQEIKECILKTSKTWVRLVIFLVASHLMVSSAASKEITLGSEKAPVTLIEYGSLTCDNCIRFHRNVFPRIKKQYIDSGTVRFIYRHFPTSDAAVRGAIASQCAGEKSYEMLDDLYSTTADWYRADNRDSVFVQKASSLGLNSEAYLSCLSDPKNLDEIKNQQQAAKQNLDVTGTPTFFINGKIVRGKRSFVEIKALVDEALK